METKKVLEEERAVPILESGQWDSHFFILFLARKASVRPAEGQKENNIRTSLRNSVAIARFLNNAYGILSKSSKIYGQFY
ncbi:MAG: hypothetical protein WCU80_01040 [Paludibacteraceae bacterium]